MEHLVAETGKSQNFYLQAILKYLDELKDIRQTNDGTDKARAASRINGEKPCAEHLRRFAGAWCGEALIREDQGRYETRRGLK